MYDAMHVIRAIREIAHRRKGWPAPDFGGMTEPDFATELLEQRLERGCNHWLPGPRLLVLGTAGRKHALALCPGALVQK